MVPKLWSANRKQKIIKAEKKEPLLPKNKPVLVKKKPDKIDGVILPKSKPLVAKKEIDKIKEKSKYFRRNWKWRNRKR